MKKAALLAAVLCVVAGCHPNYVEETVSPKDTTKATRSNAVVPESTASPNTAAPGLSQPSGGDIGDSAGGVGQAAKNQARRVATPPSSSPPDAGSPGD